MKRLIAIVLFAASGLAAEIVRPVYCSCIAESGARESRRRQGDKQQ